MTSVVYLVLEDGSVFQGYSFGSQVDTYGEVVFNTSMTGYQEILTDPSYAGQIVVLTYPLVGNYGINKHDSESRQIQVSGLVVREQCTTPSNSDSTHSLAAFLAEQNIAGIYGIDTRALTRRLRSRGVMMGIISSQSPGEALSRCRDLQPYDGRNFVQTVTTPNSYHWDQEFHGPEQPKYRIVVGDYGLKYNILRILKSRNCDVIAVPATTTAAEILSKSPDGVLLSPGPGDPALLDSLTQTAYQLLGRIPIMGICLGHQIIARALGARTFKLKFGHRGANHPVKDIATGRVYITAQNHGYAVDGDSLPSELDVSHINLNDGTVEGLVHKELPVLSIQYHSEASPGPRDNEYLFDRFLALVNPGKSAKAGRTVLEAEGSNQAQ